MNEIGQHRNRLQYHSIQYSRHSSYCLPTVPTNLARNFRSFGPIIGSEDSWKLRKTLSSWKGFQLELFYPFCRYNLYCCGESYGSSWVPNNHVCWSLASSSLLLLLLLFLLLMLLLSLLLLVLLSSVGRYRFKLMLIDDVVDVVDTFKLSENLLSVVNVKFLF